MPCRATTKRILRITCVSAISSIFLFALLSVKASRNYLALQSATARLGDIQAYSHTPKPDTVPGEILVRFRDDSDITRRDLHITQVTTERGSTISLQVEKISQGREVVHGLRLVRVAPGATDTTLAALSSRPDVLYAEPNYIWRRQSTQPNDPFYGQQWGLTAIDADKAWDITTGNSNVVVGVLDSGVDISHPDLQPNIWTNPAEIPMNGIDDDGNGFVDDVHGWDFHHGDNTIFDDEEGDDHATHVAGIIGARGNNAMGVSGVCWNVTLLPIKVLGPQGGSVANIIAGYGYAKSLRDRGVNIRVLNNSYGGPFRSQAAEDAIAQLNQSGILFVVAAGNDGRDNFKFPTYPANYEVPNVISVASASQNGSTGFSNFGRNVQLTAPGVEIWSTVPGNNYAKATGTSMAASHVSGAAALIVSAAPGISVSALKSVLIYSNRSNGGLNVFKAILAATENDTIAPAPPANLQAMTPVNGGQNIELNWIAPGDDGNVGTAATYELAFITTSGVRIPLNMPVQPGPAGTTQNLINLPMPMRNGSGTFELKAIDNVGNSSVATVFVSINTDLALGLDPYIPSVGPNSPLSTGGQRLALDGDDQYTLFTLPFNVMPGGNFSWASVSTNGAIHFSASPPHNSGGFNDDIPSSIDYLTGLPILAVLWDDLIVDTSVRADAGVFVVQPNSDTIIFRWQASTVANHGPVNFEAELHRDGTFICRYGSGNENLTPVVGLSYGDPQSYPILSHTKEYWKSGSPLSLTNAQTVTFSPRPPPPLVQFRFGSDNYQISEGEGSLTVTVLRPTTTPGGFPILGSYSVNYATSAGTAIPGVDYTETSGALSFDMGQGSKSFNVPILNDSAVDGTKTLNVILSNPTNGSGLGIPSISNISILDDDLPPSNQVSFSATSFSANESDGSLKVIVTRSGDTSNAAAVDYATSDNSGGDSCNSVSTNASSRCDYLMTLGRLTFSTGETSKTISIPIVDDVYIENSETFSITLSNASGTTLLSPFTATLTITDNDNSSPPNPIDDASFFVREHYIDFLNREPDQAGLDFWTNEITSCGPDTQCRDVKRINVSAAFFLSIEFQETGYFVDRIYKSAYGNSLNTLVPVRLTEFLYDTQQIGRGIQVGIGDWEAQLQANKQSFALSFVQRPEFLQAYPNSLTAGELVDHLNANVGSALSQSERDNLVALLGATPADTSIRAEVIKGIAENSAFRSAEFNRAFVLMQYIGYLRRNPNDQPDGNFGGYQFWLDKLNSFGGNFVKAEMVKAFILSGEYRQRFGL